MRVVINACFGGFGLSERAVLRYAELKGLTIYPEAPEGDLGAAMARLGLVNYWIKPRGERPHELPGVWASHSLDARAANNKAMQEAQIHPRDIPRDDADLVRVVEELGDAANGRCASLRVVEIPDGVEWEIEEYDGNEHVSEAHRTWA